MKRQHVWVVVAALLLTGGMTGAAVAAGTVARSDAQQSRRAFERSSGDVASTLELAIRHEEDLAVSANAFIVGKPNATNTQFVKWAGSVHALTRYPELFALGYAVMVSAAELPAFAARAVADPVGTLAPNGSFQVIPAGNRPYYCLAVGGVPGSKTPAGLDYCAIAAVGSAGLAARDSGEGSYVPFNTGQETLLVVQTPIYRGGVTPTTVAARRAAFLGWVGVTTVPKMVLDRALQSHGGTSVTMRYHLNSSKAAFSSGKVPRDAQTVTIDLHNGWTVQTFGVAPAGGLFADGSALVLLIGGAVLSILLGVLVFVLGTGRARALRLVGERTGELRHQALHDALTGLPNRALIMDRIEQLLVRNRRYGATGAALFIDLDDFKNVNDTLGHGAGDRLLVAVAARLQSALRDADTIGRMGGDEFVVLIDGASLDVAPEMVAERLLQVLRQPFELDGAAMPLTVNVSIGIAIGDRASAGDLLRDADVALYQAKAAGKNRFEIFHPEMQTTISRRIDLEFDLRSALAGEQFCLVYQPIYNLDDLTLVGVEALLRWKHPTRGVVQPDEFIPILEQTGQILAVGRWVLREACRQMADWHALGDALDVSVNVSGRQLDHDSIV